MRRGDVVLVDWPFSDRTGSKLRPAVVVQADFLNALITDTLLIAVTRWSRSATTEILLHPNVDANSGLYQPSLASCNNFLTLDQALIHRTIGSLSDATLRKIESCLKVALQLP